MDERKKRVELKNRVMEAIQLHWDETPPQGERRSAITHSRTVQGFLASTGVDVPHDAIAVILAELEDEGRIQRALIQDQEAWLIAEPRQQGVVRRDSLGEEPRDIYEDHPR